MVQRYRKGSHSLFDLKYHIVFITKYRKPVLYGGEAHRVRDIIRKVCSDLEVDILSGAVQRDHIHLLVSVPPSLSVSKLVQRVKGVSSRKMLQESPRFKKEFWGRHLWARGYFAVSTGNVTDEIIAEYIADQDKMERARTQDNFTVSGDL